MPIFPERFLLLLSGTAYRRAAVIHRPRGLPRVILSLAAAVLLAGVAVVSAAGASLGLAENLLLERAEGGAFPLVADRRAAPVFVDPADHAGVQRAAADLCADVERVSGVRPVLVAAQPPPGE